jgi:hypothetical protein
MIGLYDDDVLRGLFNACRMGLHLCCDLASIYPLARRTIGIRLGRCMFDFVCLHHRTFTWQGRGIGCMLFLVYLSDFPPSAPVPSLQAINDRCCHHPTMVYNVRELPIQLSIVRRKRIPMLPLLSTRAKNSSSDLRHLLGIAAELEVAYCLSGVLSWLLQLAPPCDSAMTQEAFPSEVGKLRVFINLGR